jgi:hypothetical protein
MSVPTSRVQRALKKTSRLGQSLFMTIQALADTFLSS